ncbi:hypothetical protein COO60DRAFT_714002 [Scenedesmus sp. NREL 46B-D3]|nr:hypothetical protein COO60DRAFT_714002 [Scenedesmus sp. NREL 46B-D3]
MPGQSIPDWFTGPGFAHAMPGQSRPNPAYNYEELYKDEHKHTLFVQSVPGPAFNYEEFCKRTRAYAMPGRSVPGPAFNYEEFVKRTPARAMPGQSVPGPAFNYEEALMKAREHAMFRQSVPGPASSLEELLRKARENAMPGQPAPDPAVNLEEALRKVREHGMPGQSVPGPASNLEKAVRRARECQEEAIKNAQEALKARKCQEEAIKNAQQRWQDIPGFAAPGSTFLQEQLLKSQEAAQKARKCQEEAIKSAQQRWQGMPGCAAPGSASWQEQLLKSQEAAQKAREWQEQLLKSQEAAQKAREWQEQLLKSQEAAQKARKCQEEAIKSAQQRWQGMPGCAAPGSASWQEQVRKNHEALKDPIKLQQEQRAAQAALLERQRQVQLEQQRQRQLGRLPAWTRNPLYQLPGRGGYRLEQQELSATGHFDINSSEAKELGAPGHALELAAEQLGLLLKGCVVYESVYSSVKKQVFGPAPATPSLKEVLTNQSGLGPEHIPGAFVDTALPQFAWSMRSRVLGLGLQEDAQQLLLKQAELLATMLKEKVFAAPSPEDEFSILVSMWEMGLAREGACADDGELPRYSAALEKGLPFKASNAAEQLQVRKYRWYLKQNEALIRKRKAQVGTSIACWSS